VAHPLRERHVPRPQGEAHVGRPEPVDGAVHCPPPAVHAREDLGLLHPGQPGGVGDDQGRDRHLVVRQGRQPDGAIDPFLSVHEPDLHAQM
jgi:hypothetical protein